MSARLTSDDSLPASPDPATTRATRAPEDTPGVGLNRPLGGFVSCGEERGAAGRAEFTCPPAVPRRTVRAPSGSVADPEAAVGQYVRRIDPHTQRYGPFGQITMLVLSASGVCWLVTFIDGPAGAWLYRAELVARAGVAHTPDIDIAPTPPPPNKASNSSSTRAAH